MYVLVILNKQEANSIAVQAGPHREEQRQLAHKLTVPATYRREDVRTTASMRVGNDSSCTKT
jgi:hypothetical protein